MVKKGRFQSLVGFKINWNTDRLGCRIDRTLFQSLIGFKINWNKNRGKN